MIELEFIDKVGLDRSKLRTFESIVLMIMKQVS